MTSPGAWIALAALVLWAGPATLGAAPAGSPWREVETDLPADPALTRGTLENGVRFAVMQHPYPRNRVSLRLLVAAGSREERDDERGLAHFVEHMAFRGTKAYAHGNLTRELQKLGIGVGPDSNAFTAYDNTLYVLELPDNRPETLGTALTVFREFAENVTFEEAAIELERRIILNEKSLRTTPEMREREFNRFFLWPDARELKRIPIGSTEIISRAGRDQLQSFYDAWYRPERMALVVAGDIDPAVASDLVRRTFSDLRGRGEPRPQPPGLVVDAAAKDPSYLYRETSINGALVVLEQPYESAFAPDTPEARKRSLNLALALAMFQARVRRASMVPDAPFSSPAIDTDGPVRDWGLISFAASSRIDNWRTTLEAMDRALRQALDHGFNAGELRQAKAEFANSYEQAARSAGTRHAGSLASSLVGHFLQGNPVVTPAAMRDEMVRQLATVTLADCLEAFRETWTEEPPRVFVGANQVFEDKPEEIARVLTASRKTPVTPAPDIPEVSFAYGDFGPPGRLERHQTIDDLAIEVAEFANGARLNFKPTTFDQDLVMVSVRVGYGRRTMPSPGLDLLAYSAFLNGGLGRHPWAELGTILAGKSVRLSFAVDDDALAFTAYTSRRDLGFCLGLVTAYLTDPAYRPDSLGEARVILSTEYSRVEMAPGGQIFSRLDRLLTGDDRFGLPEPDQMAPLTLERLTAWIGPQLKSGPLEVALVGDLTWDDALAAVSGTLGALPPREPRQPAGRSITAFVPSRGLERFTSGSQVRLGTSAVVFPVGDVATLRQERSCVMLAAILQEMLRVGLREELGATYTPSVTFSRRRAFPGLAYFAISADTLPADLAKVPPIIAKALQQLQANGVPAELFARIRQTTLREVEDDSRTNGYWLGNVLAGLQQYPEKIVEARNLTSDFTAITPAELRQAAIRYFPGSNARSFVALPPGR